MTGALAASMATLLGNTANQQSMSRLETLFLIVLLVGILVLAVLFFVLIRINLRRY